MGKATKIPINTFNGLQMDAGCFLYRFNPNAPNILDEDIITPTTGGITVSCKPTYSDFGEDVDNCPNDMKELKHLDSWECLVSTTGLGTSLEGIRLALGAADITAESSKVVPRRDLKQSDFRDIWWVGDRADGGLVAAQIKNALSTGGFELQTEKNAKGQVSIELTGHVSINNQDVMPMEFYSLDPSDTYSVEQRLSHVTTDYEENSIAIGGEAEITLTAETGYVITNVIVLMGGVDVTSNSYDSATHKITIASASGNIEVIATANEE